MTIIRKFPIRIFLILWITVLPLAFVHAASTDFEGFAVGTSANAVVVPGMTFSTTGGASPWKIYGNYTSPPYAMGHVLATFGGDTLTIQFNPPQVSISFGYGGPVDGVARLYHTGALVSTQTLPAPGLGKYTFGSLSVAGGFDKLELFATSDFVIDNINIGDSSGSAAILLPCTDDSRLNNYECSAPVAVYCRDDGGIDLYAINDESQGVLAVHVTRADIAKTGIPQTRNTLLAAQGSITLYRLTTGEFQVNATYPQDGKPYVFVWDACPAGSSYTLAH